MDELGLLSVRSDLTDQAVPPRDHNDKVPGQAEGSEALEGKATVRAASHPASQECWSGSLVCLSSGINRMEAGLRPAPQDETEQEKARRPWFGSRAGSSCASYLGDLL